MELSRKLIRQCILNTCVRNHSTVAKPLSISSDETPLVQTLRTSESNPENHTRDHLTRYYTMPPEVKNRLFQRTPLPQSYEKHLKTFGETALLVRQPAIDIISWLQQTDYSRPVNKYVLYGDTGCGKTLTLAHILHFGLSTNKVLIHVNWALDWFVTVKEKAPSNSKEGFVDLPIDAAAWLLNFKHQNALLLPTLNLNLQKDYVWNPREQNSSGSPLLQLIDFGINRMKYACDVVEAVINELKWASTAGRCNCLVVMDGFNALYGTVTRIKDSEYKLVYPDRLSLAQPFFNITKYDWCNGAIVLSVDKLTRKEGDRESFYPHYLLGERGFEHLDPFLPVEIKDYTKNEFDTVMDYYRDRMWIRDVSKQGQRELELLTNKNPLTLMKYTNPI